jgi:predicted dehydrogenase
MRPDRPKDPGRRSGLLGSLIDYRASLKRRATMHQMPPPTIPIAIVGFGSIARSHVTALRSLPVVRPGSATPRIAAIVTERPDEVRAEAASLGVQHVVESLEEALADGEIALVDVASRNDRHATQGRAVLDGDRALYIEKPIGRTAQEAESLAARALDAGRPSQVGLVMRYEPAIVEARALIREGAIGEVRHGRTGSFHGSYLDPSRPMSWRLRASSAGGGAMLDLGVHLIDALRFLLGEATLLAASARTVVASRAGANGAEEPVDVDDWSWAELEFEGGSHVTVEASRIFLGGEGVHLQLYGTEGSLVGNPDEGRLELRRFDGREAAYREIARADPFVRAVEALRPPARLSLGSFVDLHAAAMHHVLARVAGNDPTPGLAPTLSDAAAAESIAHQIVEMGRHAAPPATAGSNSVPRSPHG